MAQVHVIGGSVQDGVLANLKVKMHNLPVRELDREATISWLQDGHSLIPVIAGAELPALRLIGIEGGEEVSYFIRDDTAAESSDSLPDGLSAAGN